MDFQFMIKWGNALVGIDQLVYLGFDFSLRVPDTEQQRIGSIGNGKKKLRYIRISGFNQ